MAKKTTIGAGIALDGEKEFRQAVSGINSDMKVLTSELKKVTAEFIDNKDSIEGLTAKDEVLNKQLEKQKEKVDALRLALQNSQKEYGKNDTRTDKWQISLNNAEAELSKLNKEVKDNKDAMEKAKNPTDDMAKKVKEFGDNADKARQKALSMGDIIKANLISSGIISGIKELGSSMVGLAKDALDSADSIQQMSDQTGMSAEAVQEWQYVGDTVGTSIDTITGAQAKLTKAMNAASTGTGKAVIDHAKLAEAQAKLSIVGKECSAAQEKVNEATNKYGANSKEASKASLDLEKAQLNLLKAQNDVDTATEGKTEKINAQGEAFNELGIKTRDANGNLRDVKTVTVEALDALGKVSNETERDALAMTIFGKSAMELNPLIKAGSSEIANLTKEARENGAVMSNETVSGLDNFGDAIGQVKQSLKAMAGTVLSELTPSLEPLIEKVKKIDMKPLTNALKFIIDNSGTIIAGLAGIGAGLLAFNVVTMIQGVVGAMKAFKLANEGATISQMMLNLVMKANPIGIIITLITSVVAAVAVLWKTNDKFREGTIKVFKDVTSGIGDFVKSTITFFTKTIPSAFNKFIGFIKSNWQGLLLLIVNPFAGAFKLAYDNCESFRVNVDKFVGKVKTSIKNMATGMINAVKELPSNFKTVGKHIVEGMWNGISDAKQWVINKIKGFGSDIMDGIKSFFGIHSPSRKMRDEVGIQLAHGVAEGITEGTGKAKKSAEEMGEAILSAAKTKLDNYKVYHKMSLEQEVKYWDTIRKECKKGTQARVDADKEYLEAVKTSKTEQKRILEEKLNAEKTYKENCKKVSDELVQNVNTATKAYNDAVESRTKTIVGSLGLFDVFSKDQDVTGQELLSNLQSQVSGIYEWSDGLKALENRGISTGLLNELQEMGVKASAEIIALNTLTDEQLAQYVNLWQQKTNLARTQAVSELTGLKEETTKKINDLNTQTNKDLKSYYKSYKDAMKELGVAIKEPVKLLKATVTEDGQEIVANVTKAIQKEAKSKTTKSRVSTLNNEIRSTLSGIVGQATSIGQNLVLGLIDGMNSQRSALALASANLVSTTVTSAKKAGKINSPSRLMRDEVGYNLAKGISVGFTDEMNNVTKDIYNSIPKKFDIRGNNSLESNVSGINKSNSPSNTVIDYDRLTQSFINAFSIYKPQVILNHEKVGDFIMDTVVKEGFA